MLYGTQSIAIQTKIEYIDNRDREMWKSHVWNYRGELLLPTVKGKRLIGEINQLPR